MDIGFKSTGMAVSAYSAAAAHTREQPAPKPAKTDTYVKTRDTAEISKRSLKVASESSSDIALEMEAVAAGKDFSDAVSRYMEENHQELDVNLRASVDPGGRIYAETYIRSLAKQYRDAENAVREYYSKAHRENLAFENPNNHISEKYLWPDSTNFKSDMSAAERQMAARQERAMLWGGSITLGDPYALASKGGVLSISSMDRIAREAAESKIEELIRIKKKKLKSAV
ncbi:MAG: hypothetical protein HDT24_04990 [Ruminococcus sp.]|nr:hypothetical protein [Ruminococcus sp.]